MKIKPVDNVYFGAHLPPKQHNTKNMNEVIKILQKWNYRNKEFGARNIGERVISKALHKWCEICDVPNDKVNNMWARKTFVNTGIHDLQLPAQQIMNVSGHKNE